MNRLRYYAKTGMIGIKAILDARHSGHRTITIEKDEYRFAIDSTAVAWELRFVDELERPFYKAIRNTVDKETVFYDIGANIGYYTVTIGSHVDRVIAFEPHPQARDLLLRNIDLNSLMDDHVYRIGLADTEMTAGITDPYLFGQTKRDPEGDRIDVKPLDMVQKDDNLPAPDVIKIDVEGDEQNVLVGMEETLTRDQPILFIEVHNNVDELVSFLEEHGYTWDIIMRRPDGTILGKATVEA